MTITSIPWFYRGGERDGGKTKAGRNREGVIDDSYRIRLSANICGTPCAPANGANCQAYAVGVYH